MSTYSGTSLDMVSTSGGVTVIAVAVNPTNPASVDCKEVWLQSVISNTERIVVALGSAVSSIAGIIVPQAVSSAILSAGGSPQAFLQLPIDNLNKLWFWAGIASESVAVMWRK